MGFHCLSSNIWDSIVFQVGYGKYLLCIQHFLPMHLLDYYQSHPEDRSRTGHLCLHPHPNILDCPFLECLP